MDTNNQNNNNNQTSLPTNNQDVLNQPTNSVNSNEDLDQQKSESTPEISNVKMSEAPKNTAPLNPPFLNEPQSSEDTIESFPPQSTEVVIPEMKESLKDYNSIPIDAPPTPGSLSDSLEASKSLTGESSFDVDNNSKTTPPSEVTPEPQPDPQVETPSEVTPEPQPDPQVETPSEVTPEPQPNPQVETPSEVTPEPQPDPQVETPSEPNLELNTEPEIKPELISTPETFSPKSTTQNPQDIKQKIEDVLSYGAQGKAPASLSDKKGSSALRFLFILSLIVFILIVGALVYFLTNPVNKINSEVKTETTPTNIPNQSSVVCELNGFVYNQGQSFPSADGCNTCTCVSADNIICTEKECSGIPATTTVSATPTTRSISVTPTVSTNSSTIKTTPTEVKTNTGD